MIVIGKRGIRSAPAGHETEPVTDATTQPRLVPVQSLLLTPRTPLLFQRPPHIPMRRIPNQSGKEGATNIPSFARGATRYADETPAQFARRVMDERWGKGKWEDATERMAEFKKIQKFGQRSFEMPSGLGVLEDDRVI